LLPEFTCSTEELEITDLLCIETKLEQASVVDVVIFSDALVPMSVELLIAISEEAAVVSEMSMALDEIVESTPGLAEQPNTAPGMAE
jgi:precorrin-4 methylase